MQPVLAVWDEAVAACRGACRAAICEWEGVCKGAISYPGEGFGDVFYKVFLVPAMKKHTESQT